MLLTVKETQDEFKRAIEKLETTLIDVPIEDASRLHLALAALRAFALYSNSLNSVPGYSGLGLQEAYIFAKRVNSETGVTERTVPVRNFKNIFQELLG